MTGVLSLINSLLVLGVLIFVHELGHFLLAKWAGVGVLEFSIGFGRKIWKRTLGETTYSIGLIPLGGYVRMIGDEPEALERLQERKEYLKEEEGELAEEERESLQQEELLLQNRNRWFLEKSYFKKSMIVLAGPGFNILFAVLLAFCSFLIYGASVPVNEPVVGTLMEGYPAKEKGLQKGDRILSVNGVEVETWEALSDEIINTRGAQLTLNVRREQEGKPVEEFQVEIQGQLDTPELAILEGREKEQTFKIGIVPRSEREQVSVLEAAGYSVKKIWYITEVTFRGLFAMIAREISAKNIAGPIYIFNEAAASAERGLDSLFDFMIFLSVSLAIINLFPIPILDGGHLVFFTIEALKGSPVNVRYQQMANQVGMALLLLLMIFAVGNDIARLVG